ncbi:MAG: hypothetical protein U0350_30675 [Caldilineaceae bacterium]
MSRIILLDAGPLGLITNPHPLAEAQLCKQWLARLLADNIQVLVPEITDYEVRRELLRAGKVRGIRNLEALTEQIGYLPLNTANMRQAALFWAQLRQQGLPTADFAALDGDVILASQALQLIAQGHDVAVATTNVGHLTRLVPAQTWQAIRN